MNLSDKAAEIPGFTVVSSQNYTGERALFQARDLFIEDSSFDSGESPLKECRHLRLNGVSFRWKYPLWYSRDIEVKNAVFFEMARAGIWYTDDISVADTVYEAPKSFRRVNRGRITGVEFPNALETLWNCADMEITRVTAKGDYFAMNLNKASIIELNLIGNYGFDGARDIEIANSKLLTKDAFWNSENITIRNSLISGEYFAWNSRNVTLEDCVIDSLQGLCYIENLTLRNCRLRNTTLAFEYCRNIDAEITGPVKSIFNPLSGRIAADSLQELILDPAKIDPDATEILVKDGHKPAAITEPREFAAKEP